VARLDGVTRNEQWRALVLSTFALTVCFAVWTISSIIGPRIKTELGLSESQFGLLVATPILMGSVSRIFLGIRTEQFGGRLMFPLKMLITSLYRRLRLSTSRPPRSAKAAKVPNRITCARSPFGTTCTAAQSTSASRSG
jgi:sugar phosphate permease